MESRKYLLQTQIIEALKAKDNDLYSLLKSQWAHRFGVESLEELENLDLDESDQKTIDLNNQKIEQSQRNSFEDDKAIHKKDDDNQAIEINNKEFESIKYENDESFKITSYEIAHNEKKVVNPVNDNKNLSDIAALIPLPPKPKYSYLKKWLLIK